MTELEKAAREFQEKKYPIWTGKGMAGGFHDAFVSGTEWQAKQSPWISVEERLPSSDNDLYIALNTKMTPPGIDVCEFDVKSKRWTDSRHVIVYPTHWMPIPE